MGEQSRDHVDADTMAEQVGGPGMAEHVQVKLIPVRARRRWTSCGTA